MHVGVFSSILRVIIMLISSKENAVIKEYIKLRDKSKYRRETSLFVLEGSRIAMDAVLERVDIKYAFITEEARIRYPETASALENYLGSSLYDITNDIADRIADTKGSQGIFAIAKRLDKPVVMNKINNGGKFVILNSLQDPGNVGTILRAADACGIDCVFLTGDSCDVYNPKIVRSTMGSLFRLPVCDDYGYAELISMLKNAGILTCASVIDKDAESVRNFDFGNACAVVIGNEGNGLTCEEALMCDKRVTIKMSGNINSLNAAMAASIIMWEMTK